MGDRLSRLRASVGRIGTRVYPGLDQVLWTARRNRLARSARASRTVPRTPFVPPHDAIRLLIVATGDGDAGGKWRPGCGNHFFEVAQSAVDLLGSDRVEVMHVPDGEPAFGWHERVYARAREFGSTHILGNIETDPRDTADWTWDLFLDGLRDHWAGVFLGLMYDSAFDWTLIHAKRLVARDPRTLLIALDRPIADLLPGPLTHVGPVILPISRPSQDAILAAIADLPKDIDVSFIGALYDYRVPLLDGMTAAGLPISINPQRPDEARTYEESRTAQPGYLDYVRALARSRVTLNLSRAHTEDTQQLKTRVLEASFAGCVVATDDRDRSDHYFTAGTEFLRFGGINEGVGVIQAILDHPEDLDRVRHAATRRAHEIADSVFWRAVDQGLLASHLPPVLPRDAGAVAA